MRGSIRSKGPGRWEIRISLGRDPNTGQKRVLSRSCKGTKDDADALCARLLLEHGDTNLDGWDATVADLVDRWFAMASPDLSPTTAADYESVIRRHIVPRIGSAPVRTTRAVQLDALYVDLRAAGVGTARIRRVHQVLANAFAQAVRWEWIANNPARSASPPPVARRSDIHPPSIAEAAALFDAAAVDDPDLACFLRLSLVLGARRGELVGLQWHDLDLDAMTVHIRRAVVTTKGGVTIKSTKTDRGRRFSLSQAAVVDLRAQRRRSMERALSVGEHLADDGWVFSLDPASRTPWRPEYPSKRFDRLRAAAGLEHVKLREFRHANATQLLAAGVDISTVSERLGHARKSTTLDRYADFLPVADRAAADAMDRILGL